MLLADDFCGDFFQTRKGSIVFDEKLLPPDKLFPQPQK